MEVIQISTMGVKAVESHMQSAKHKALESSCQADFVSTEAHPDNRQQLWLQQRRIFGRSAV